MTAGFRVMREGAFMMAHHRRCGASVNSGRREFGSGGFGDLSYTDRMTQVAELLKEASKLDMRERVELISSLLEDIDPSPHYVSDEEALQRLHELKSGKVQGLSEDAFWKACGRSQ
jgi:hypothetical protein